MLNKSYQNKVSLYRVMMLATGSAGGRRVTVCGSSSSVMARSTVLLNMLLYHQVRYNMVSVVIES